MLRNPSKIPDLPAIHVADTDSVAGQPPKPRPPPHVEPNSHPILQLIQLATKDAETTLKRQSKTLEEAVAEYRKRYQIHPPPNFDKWYELAKKHNVQLIDEYDSIYHNLLPFWAIPPDVLRLRVQEALGFVGENSHQNWLMSLTIRNGTVADIKEALVWQQEATSGMMNEFIQYLPDMDLAFNIHDEPRVIIQHDDLQRLVNKALDEALPANAEIYDPEGTWSPRPKDLNDGKSFKEVRTTRFNRFAHQAVWSYARQSCPPTSPARSLDEFPQDDIAPYVFASSDLGFISNKTAFQDICNSPSLRETFGFFDRPNSFDVVNDLFPIFSQSKVSSFQDILYPSPWYWATKVPYTESKDHRWIDKQNVLWWRGSTTGGFSRGSGWRRQHRQRVVQLMNGHDKTEILENTGTILQQKWKGKEVPKPDHASLFDVHFTSVGQCDPGDCDAQREFFKIEKEVQAEDAWYYKFLLDMDGNAFSGRFYSFLRSKSLPFKMSVFQEWHDEWIKPWLHYVPLSLHGDEYFETVRYFDQDTTGKEQAIHVAESGREWANKTLRNEDLEVWFFRLLLEYGRLVDDNRENLGFKL